MKLLDHLVPLSPNFLMDEKWCHLFINDEAQAITNSTIESMLSAPPLLGEHLTLPSKHGMEYIQLMGNCVTMDGEDSTK